jgi:Cu2+-exporting ATPase
VHQSLLIAVAVLLITCPCALGLAVPVAQVVASGALMRRGILVKDGSALERLAEADRVLLDKTGTLTLGRPEPVDIMVLTARQQGIARALMQASNHPLGRGLSGALALAGVAPAAVENIREQAGEGMTGRIDGHAVAIGRPQHSETGLSVEYREAGSAPVLVRFTDFLRPDADAALAQLQALHLDAMIVSGDRAEAVGTVARQLGISAVPEARPQDKLDLIARLQGAGHRVLMVGDGLNDGPALAAAHVSIAPSSASDVGQQASDLVFMGDGLSAVPCAVRAARATRAIVRQNFVLAIGYNILAVPLAIGGFVTPLVAALAMSLSSLIVVGNSLRLVRAAR